MDVGLRNTLTDRILADRLCSHRPSVGDGSRRYRSIPFGLHLDPDPDSSMDPELIQTLK